MNWTGPRYGNLRIKRLGFEALRARQPSGHFRSWSGCYCCHNCCHHSPNNLAVVLRLVALVGDIVETTSTGRAMTISPSILAMSFPLLRDYPIGFEHGRLVY